MDPLVHFTILYCFVYSNLIYRLPINNYCHEIYSFQGRFHGNNVLIGERNTIVSAYTMYRHLE